MDYPRNIVVPPFISSWSRWMNGNVMHSTASIGIPSSLAWTANAAVFIPMLLPWPYRVARAFWALGSSVAGNSDIGIYSKGGALIWSSGSTAQSGGGLQFVTPLVDLLLEPGEYVIAYSHNGTTNRYAGSGTIANTGRLGGLVQMASGFPLPAALVPEQYAGVGYPLIGITNTETGG